MKLKMSTLLIIIAIVFFAYYYLRPKPQLPIGPLPVPEPIPGDLPIGPMPVPEPMPDDGVTILEIEEPPMMENFNVSGSGNVRPDNVMQVEEHLTYV